MKRLTILLLIFCLLMTGCSQKQEPQQEEPPVQDQETVQAPVEVPEEPPAEEPRPTPEPVSESQLEGELLSPDGRFAVSVEGTGNLYANGLSAPEHLRVTDAESGEVLWETEGSLYQRVQWSPAGQYMVLAYGGRTWNQVLILHTETWMQWQFTLPDGNIIPDYDFLPEEDWCRWIEEDRLVLTVGRGGDAGEQRTYQCSLFLQDGGLEGYVLEVTAAPIAGGYDFNHDGVVESLELATIWSSENPEQAAWYELRVRQGEEILWLEEASTAHVGWNSLFALRTDGEDFLLRYNPYMNQGTASYRLQLFALGENGAEVVVHEEAVAFDINFGSPTHHVFDPEAVADFLWAAKTLIDGSHLLLSTDGGTLITDVPETSYEVPVFREEFKAASHTGELADLLRKLEGNRTEVQMGISTKELLSDDYDFNHNGIPEKVYLVTQMMDAGSGRSFWQLEVTELNKTLWSDSAYAAHAGWNSLFACRVEGEDYLLRYNPTMYQGFCTYSYEVFALDAAGKELPVRRSSVEFDINWNSPRHEFDAEELLAFVEQLNEDLAEGSLLLNTDDEVKKMDPKHPQETLPWLQEDDLCPDFSYRKSADLETNLKNLENAMRVAGASKG